MACISEFKSLILDPFDSFIGKPFPSEMRIGLSSSLCSSGKDVKSLNRLLKVPWLLWAEGTSSPGKLPKRPQGCSQQRVGVPSSWQVHSHPFQKRDCVGLDLYNLSLS